jgi:hypothetical protein
MKIVTGVIASSVLLACKIATAGCSSSFYQNPLGSYTIQLQSTMNAIQSGDDESGYPYYEKTWRGPCPGGLDGSDDNCVEFTVYPTKSNFAPGNIMHKIEQYTHGRRNRGEVRIITNSDQTQYVYTTNHEKTFCGPYAVPQS